MAMARTGVSVFFFAGGAAALAGARHDIVPTASSAAIQRETLIIQEPHGKPRPWRQRTGPKYTREGVRRPRRRANEMAAGRARRHKAGHRASLHRSGRRSWRTVRRYRA